MVAIIFFHARYNLELSQLSFMGSWAINQEDISFLSRFPESLLATIYNPEPGCSKLSLDYPGLM